MRHSWQASYIDAISTDVFDYDYEKIIMNMFRTCPERYWDHTEHAYVFNRMFRKAVTEAKLLYKEGRFKETKFEEISLDLVRKYDTFSYHHVNRQRRHEMFMQAADEYRARQEESEYIWSRQDKQN
jgi:glycogen synthase